MKKRIVSVIVVIALMSTLLAGCNLITLNAERDGSQVVSTVNVEGLEGIVTKTDLVGFFNQLGYMYIQYYGWTPEKIITEFTTQLSNKEILVLNATKVIAEDKGISLDEVKKANNAYVANAKIKGTKAYDGTIRPFDLFKLFGADEQLYVINETNRQLEESYKAILEDVKAEHAANAPIEEDKEENKDEDKKEEAPLAPRKERPLSPKTEFEKDPSITADAIKADIFKEMSFFAEMDKKATNKELSAVEKEAYNKFLKQFEKTYKSAEIAWNVILDGQKEYRLMKKYQDEYVNKDVAATDAEVLARYNFTVNADLAKVATDAAYKSAYEADTNHDLLVHNGKTGYFTVKSILLQFNADQKKALEDIKKGAIIDSDNKVAIAEARDQLATNPGFGMVGIEGNVGGIKVNVSNPLYDPKAVCEDKNCTCIACPNNKDYKKGNVCTDKNCKCEKCVNSAYDRYDVPFETILSEMSVALRGANDIIMPESISADVAMSAAAKLNAKMDVFDDYIYLVNDDPGMFEKMAYAVSAKGESQYVAEYVALARELSTLGVGAVGGLGEKKVANPINEKDPAIKIHSYVAKDANGAPIGDEINYIVNDFGIHIVMVTFVADEDAANTTKISEGSDTYRLNLDSNTVVKYANEYVVDEKGRPVLKDGKKQLKAVKNMTVREKLADAIVTEKRNENNSKMEEEVTKKYESTISRNEKVINSIIKDIEDSLKAQGYDSHHNHNH